MNDYIWQSLAIGFGIFSFLMLGGITQLMVQDKGIKITPYEGLLGVAVTFSIFAILFIGGGKLYALIEFSLKG